MNAPTLPEWLRPIFSRVVAALVAALLGYLAHKGIDLGLSEAQHQEFADALTAVASGIALSVYGVVHKMTSAKTNPTDAAAPALAKVATGPMGDGERHALAATLDHAASTGETLTPPPKAP